MRPVTFLLIAAAVALLGFVLMGLRHRQPKGIDSGIRAHRKHMSALSSETRRDVSSASGVNIVRRTEPATGPPAVPSDDREG